MSLDRVFSESNSTPLLELRIDGAPLAELLGDMVRVIRSQQKELDALRRDAEDRIYRSECKLQEHEDAIRNFSEDLKLHMRPISFHRQQPLLTMADAVNNVESRLVRVEKKGKNDTAVRLEEMTVKKLAVMFYNRWFFFRRMRANGRMLFECSRKYIWQRYMRKWNCYLTLRATHLARQRHLQGLLETHERRVMLTYWHTWLQCLSARDETRIQRRMYAHKNADMILSLISRGIARRFLHLWVKFVETIRNLKDRVQGALLLEQKTARLLAERYLQKWLDAHRWRQVHFMRLRILEAMRSRICRSLVHSGFKVWQSFVLKRQQRRRVLSLIPYFHHTNLAAVARRYFFRFQAFGLARRDMRTKEALEQRLNALNERTNELQRQLDMGLHTLAHTNSVLARVVDTVMIAEEPRSALQHLLQEEMLRSSPAVPSMEKANDTFVPFVSPTINTSLRIGETMNLTGSEWQQASEEQSLISAGDMLRKLRARLDQTYKGPLNEP